MPINSIISFAGKKQWAALAVLACCFGAFMAFDLGVWYFVAGTALFVGYATWTATAFFASQGNFSGRRIAACALPVGIAIVQALVCFGVVWVIAWAARQVFGH
jgi:hypothetical protein